MNRPTVYATLAETPIAVGSGPGRVGSIYARNSNATLAYVKLYESTAAPGGSAVPCWAGPVPQGSFSFPSLNIDGASFWVVASTDFGAGLTAPAAPLQVSVTFERA